MNASQVLALDAEIRTSALKSAPVHTSPAMDPTSLERQAAGTAIPPVHASSVSDIPRQTSGPAIPDTLSDNAAPAVTGVTLPNSTASSLALQSHPPVMPYGGTINITIQQAPAASSQAAVQAPMAPTSGVHGSYHANAPPLTTSSDSSSDSRPLKANGSVDVEKAVHSETPIFNEVPGRGHLSERSSQTAAEPHGSREGLGEARPEGRRGSNDAAIQCDADESQGPRHDIVMHNAVGMQPGGTPKQCESIMHVATQTAIADPSSSMTHAAILAGSSPSHPSRVPDSLEGNEVLIQEVRIEG